MCAFLTAAKCVPRKVRLASTFYYRDFSFSLSSNYQGPIQPQERYQASTGIGVVMFTVWTPQLLGNVKINQRGWAKGHARAIVEINEGQDTSDFK